MNSENFVWFNKKLTRSLNNEAESQKRSENLKLKKATKTRTKRKK